MLDPDLNPLPNPSEIFEREHMDMAPTIRLASFYAGALILTALMLLVLAKALALI